MSRKATAEYISAKRRAYAEADREKRRRIFDEICETTGCDRKHANKLLAGNGRFREHKGRGKTRTGAKVVAPFIGMRTALEGLR